MPNPAAAQPDERELRDQQGAQARVLGSLNTAPPRSWRERRGSEVIGTKAPIAGGAPRVVALSSMPSSRGSVRGLAEGMLLEHRKSDRPIMPPCAV